MYSKNSSSKTWIQTSAKSHVCSSPRFPYIPGKENRKVLTHNERRTRLMSLWCLIQEHVWTSRTKQEPQTLTWQKVREPMGKQVLLNGHTQSMQELVESTAALGGCAQSFQCSSSSWPGLLHSASLGYSLTETGKGLQLLPFFSSQQILIQR